MLTFCRVEKGRSPTVPRSAGTRQRWSKVTTRKLYSSTRISLPIN
jgi:hypothetical protein